MSTVREQFSDAFPNDTFGIITGSNGGVTQFPNVPGRLFRLLVDSDSSAGFRIGSIQNSGSAVMPYELAAGYDTGWNPLQGNLNRYLYSGVSGTNYLVYWVQG